VVALAGVLYFGIFAGVLIGVAVSLLVLLYQTNHQPVQVLGRQPGTRHWRAITEHGSEETIAGLTAVRAGGRLYFANAQRVCDHVIALVDAVSPAPRAVVFDASEIPDLEFTALMSLAGLDRDLQRRGIRLCMAGLHRVPAEMVQRALERYEGNPVRLFDDVDAAVAAFELESGQSDAGQQEEQR
jgi:sulfate permease, SulP family